MLYNFLSGQTANLLSDLLGSSIQEMQNLSYDLESSEIESDELGYFTRDKYGNTYRLGLFLTLYGKTFLRSPALHIDYCETAEKFKSRLNYTNSQIVTYYSLDRQKRFADEKLSVCKNCMKIAKSKLSVRITGNELHDFLLAIEEDDNLKCKISNSEGYASNWQQISRAYRESKKYTCENCSFKMDDQKQSKFWQTHHIKGNEKLNNKRSNLKCLCIKCHSEVDDYHKQQFTSIENLLLLEQFDTYRKTQQ